MDSQDTLTLTMTKGDKGNMKRLTFLCVFIITFLRIPHSRAGPQVVAVGIPEIKDEFEDEFEIPDSCVDLDFQCTSLEERRECENNQTYMESACARTCGTCIPESKVKECVDLRSECDGWGQRGECDLNPAFMNVNCPQTCKRCPPASINDCVDQHEYCFLGSLAGACRTNPSFYLIFCPDSCKKFIPVCNTQRSSTVTDLCLDQARGIEFDCGIDPTTAAVSRKKRYLNNNNDNKNIHSRSNTSHFEPWRDYHSYIDMWNKMFSGENNILEDVHDKETVNYYSKNVKEAVKYVNTPKKYWNSPTIRNAVESTSSVLAYIREIYDAFPDVKEFFWDTLMDRLLSNIHNEASSLNNHSWEKRQISEGTNLLDFCTISIPLPPVIPTTDSSTENPYVTPASNQRDGFFSFRQIETTSSNNTLDINICTITVVVAVPLVALVGLVALVAIPEVPPAQPLSLIPPPVIMTFPPTLPPTAPPTQSPTPVPSTPPPSPSTVQPFSLPTPLPTTVPPLPPPAVAARARTLVPFCTASGYESIVSRLKRLVGRNTGRPISPIAASLIVAVNFCHHGLGLPETTLGVVPPAPEHFQAPSGMEIFLNDMDSIDLLEPPKRYPGISLPAMYLYQGDNMPPPPPKRDRPTTVIITVIVNGTVMSNVTSTIPGTPVVPEAPVDPGSVPIQEPMGTPSGDPEVPEPIDTPSGGPEVPEPIDTQSGDPEISEPVDTSSEGPDSQGPMESSPEDPVSQDPTDDPGPDPVDEKNLRSRDAFSCGGALISPYHVLTAAHCLLDRREGRTTGRPRYLKPSVVRLGEVDFNNPSESQAFDYVVSGIQVHEGYALPVKYNDIAIITLRDRVEFTSALRPFCLPQQVQNLVGRVCTVSGWGRLPDGFASSVLHNIDVQVVSQGDCNDVYTIDPATRPSFNIQYPEGVTNNIICAGIINDVCRGDSGGPLVLAEGGILQEVGIVSAGFGCGSARYPGIYTRVDQYTDWISDELNGDCGNV